jgi:3-oxoacyl-[acyl-carrier-protein] synthase-3
LVIVATMSADEITPNCAPRVAHAIGAVGAAAFDIGAACTGFLAGLAQAAAMIEVGRAERVLLIGAEKLTRITDFDDKKTGMLFGDGAGAVVLGPTQSGSGIGPIDLSADGGLADTIVATPEDPFIRMDGISTFKIAIKRLSESTMSPSRRPASSSTTSTCSSTTRPTRASQGGRRAARARPRQGRRLHRAARQHERRLDPADALLAREDGRLRPAQGARAADRRGFTWGAGVMEWSGS